MSNRKERAERKIPFSSETSVSLLSCAVDETIFSNEFSSILPSCNHHPLSVTCAAVQELSKGQTDGVVKDKGMTAASAPSYTLS